MSNINIPGMTWRILDWMADERTFQSYSYVASLQHQQHNIHVARKANLIDHFGYFHPLLLPVGGTQHQASESSQQMSATFNSAMYKALLMVEEKERKSGS